jgi:hypothetical protein
MMHNLAFATTTKLIAQCFLLQNAASATTDTPVASCCCKHRVYCVQTLQGQPPDIWHKLPDKALAAALLNYREAPRFDWDVQAALRSMSKAATEHSLLLEREVRELRDTVECLEGEQEEQEDKQDTQEGEISDCKGRPKICKQRLPT